MIISERKHLPDCRIWLESFQFP
ncbi:hypothetical protein F383_39311 [Gossypium arboreum]|uniref:Uncharacterized protein n=1 Tax=Gossypium arboreum TaxID=29729 RepID=A0A0B0MM97_GOSAR|nr:hypothetical protein F383_39311 [Gossypium arboreum]